VLGEVASQLADGFYEALFLGAPVDVALAEARRRVDRNVPGQKDWALPVLYMGEPVALVPSRRAPAVTFEAYSPSPTDPGTAQQVRVLRAREKIALTNLEAMAAQETRARAQGTVPPFLGGQLEEQRAALEKIQVELESLGATPRPRER
jgi:hypothetical protein